MQALIGVVLYRLKVVSQQSRVMRFSCVAREGCALFVFGGFAMKKMVCEMCGSNNIIKQDGLYVCQYCGTKYSLEEAKKLFVEGTVQIDNSKEINNLYALARRALDNSDYEKGKRYYEQILLNNPDDWESNFYSLYCKAMCCKIAEIQTMLQLLTESLSTNMELISKIVDKDKKYAATKEMSTNLLDLDSILHNAEVSHYNKIDGSIRDKYLQDYVNTCLDSILLSYMLGEAIEIYFGEEYAKDLSVPAWKQGVQQHKALMPNLAKKEIQTAEMMKRVKLIQKYDSDYQTPNVSTGGCYIATSVYGSYDCPEVWVLRRYRDNRLALTKSGKVFIKVYYAISPKLVKHFGNTYWFNRIFRTKLDRKVSKLKAQGFSDNAYSDK